MCDSQQKQMQSGVAAFFIIVVVGAAALLMSVGASLLGMGELTSGFTYAKGEEVFALADGCLEEALERVRQNPAITPAALAASSPPYPNGSCVLVASPSSPLITLVITASHGEYYKKITAVINPTLSGAQLVSQEEVSD